MYPILENILYLVIALNLSMGLWVLIKNPKHAIHISFFIFVFGISSWTLGVLLLYKTHDFVFDPLALSGGFITFIGTALFAYVFPSRKSIALRSYILLLPILVASLGIPFHVYIQRIIIHSNGIIEPVNGPLFFVYALIGIVYFVCAPLYFFTQNYRGASLQEKTQMKYLALGISIFTLFSITFDVLLPLIHIYELNSFGPISSIACIGLTSYAIVRHQLMDIKVIIQRGLIYSVLFFLIGIIYVSLLFLSESFFDSSEEISTPLYAGFIMLFGILTIPHIEKYFRRITDPIFFKDHYDYGKSLEELSKIMNASQTSLEMTSVLLNKLREIFRTNDVRFLPTTDGKKPPETANNLKGINAYVIIRNETIGVFVVGNKLSGDSYTQKDRQLLRTFAELASLAFEKAELSETLKDYSKSLEKKIYARTKEIQELSENQRKLFDDISHALQTPLTILKGSIESIKSEVLTKSNSLHPIEQSIDRLSRLIREILVLARIDGNVSTETIRPIPLSELIRETIDYINIVCTEKGIQTFSDIAPDVYVEGNEKELEEALINILSNSINYTSACKTKKLFIELTHQGTSAQITLRDTGIGIAPEHLPHIFERFYRAHERDSTGKPGNGLGLAIVKKLVEKNKGTIVATSTLGEGTEMKITLPSAARPTTPTLPVPTQE